MFGSTSRVTKIDYRGIFGFYLVPLILPLELISS